MNPPMFQPICYLDMDGVLVDFVSGALALHRSDLPYEEVAWELDKQLGMEPEQFWGPMDRDFWANLSWTPEGKYLLQGIEKRFGNRVAIATSPGDERCMLGKLDWLRRELPQYVKRTFFGQDKSLLAGWGRILVDDCDGHVAPFHEQGGQAILFPRPWNRRRHLRSLRSRDLVALVLIDIDRRLEAMREAWSQGCHEPSVL